MSAVNHMIGLTAKQSSEPSRTIKRRLRPPRVLWTGRNCRRNEPVGLSIT
jgi:hypothetical protein